MWGAGRAKWSEKLPNPTTYPRVLDLLLPRAAADRKILRCVGAYENLPRSNFKIGRADPPEKILPPVLLFF